MLTDAEILAAVAFNKSIWPERERAHQADHQEEKPRGLMTAGENPRGRR